MAGAMVARNLPLPPDELQAFCRRHHIRRLALFGSVLRADFGPESDLDVLVEFDPQHVPGWDIVAIEDEFSRLVGGRRVDMVNPKYLLPRLRERILASAELQFEAPHGEG